MALTAIHAKPNREERDRERDGEKGEKRSGGETEGARENETSQAVVCQELEPQSPQ